MRSYVLATLLPLFLLHMAHAQLIIAHRGASYDAPENTLAAFRLAFEQGADGIEGDFHLTADGHIVCIHDKDTKRTAKEQRNRSVRRSTLAQLQELDVGRWKGKQFAGERIATLDQILEVLPPKMVFFIEIKCGPEIVPALVKSITHSGTPLEQLRVISFNAQVVAAVKECLPELRAYWLVEFEQGPLPGQRRPSKKTILARLKAANADGLDCSADIGALSKAFIQDLRERKLELHVWTVDKPDLARRVKKLGVDSITTNRPGYLREKLAED